MPETLAEVKDIPLAKQLSVRVFVGLLVFLFLVLGATYFAIQEAAQRTLVARAEKLHQEIGQKIVLKLGERVAGTESLARSLAKLGETLPNDPNLYAKVIPGLLESEEATPAAKRLIAGGGIWPEPYQFTEGVERRSFFWSREENGSLVYFDNYNESAGTGYHNEEWYVPARYLKPGDVYWSKSYMDPYSFVPMVTCTAPILNNGRFAGVATVDLRLDGISEFMSEQAEQIEGYAFAVDRNNRLISFPDADLGKQFRKDDAGNEVVEYRLVGEIAPENASFTEIAQLISDFHVDADAGQNDSVEGESSWLAQKIAAESYQIESDEALLIASSLMYGNGRDDRVQYFRLEEKLFLNQPASVSLFLVPSTGWKVLVAMPSEYSDKAVAEVAGNVAKAVLLVVSVICILLYAYLWLSIFSPAKKLRKEVRKLALGEKSGTILEFEGDDELGRIAYWFNQRTGQLNEALGELKESNAELEVAKHAAESASLTKNVFLASMSHEIRTPMNAIIGLSALLCEMELGKEQENFVRTIRSSSESLLSLINDILDYTKIEANELDLETIPFNLRGVIDELAKTVSVQAEEKGLGLSCYLDTDSKGLVLGDPGRLRQILLNLASNAVKFTLSGRVDIYGKCIEETDTDYLFEFTVKDTGIGIPEEAFDSLFESFRQVDSTTTRKYGGTGLGLAICKRLCGKMGGDIRVSSKQGLGSEFAFTVMLGKPENAAKAERSVTFEAVDWDVFVVDNDWPHGENLIAELRRMKIRTKLFIDFSEMEAGLQSSQRKVLVFVGRVHGMSHEQSLKKLVSLDQPNLAGVISFASPLRLYAVNPSVKASLADSLDKPFSRTGLIRILKTIQNDGVSLDTEKSRSGDEGVLAGHTILLVEDHPVNQKVALRILSKLGVDCVVANDGQEAVQIVSDSDKIDAILMDWQMPVMDGLEASRVIRSMGDWRARIPIIAMTANAMNGDREQCISAGMTDYLSKPVVPERIREVLIRVFELE